MLTWCYLQTKSVPDALQSGLRAVQLSNRSSAALSALAYAEAIAGNLAGALELQKEIETLAGRMYVSGCDRALAALAIRNVPQTLQHLEQARTDRDWWLCWLEVDPRWDPLRSHARFRKLLPRREGHRASKQGRLYAGVISAALVVAIFLGWWLTRRPVIPFANPRISKVTSNGHCR